MYVTDQPSFLNGAVEIETKLSPHALLHRIKEIERDLGRDLQNGIRNGPRPIDLDIIFYGVEDKHHDPVVSKEASFHVQGGQVVDTTDLTIPHPRMAERDFVLSPMSDLNKQIVNPVLQMSIDDMMSALSSEDNSAVQVVPLPRNRMLCFNDTSIMGILNVTPDSFSDGGKYGGSVDLAVHQALQMIDDGAAILDIGGESTRPGAKEVEVSIELERTIPVIQKIREGKVQVSI